MNDVSVRIAGDSAPSAAAAEVAEQDAFALVYEAACIAQDHADKPAHAAIRGDRAGARLHACLLSRATRRALLTIEQIAQRGRA
jgi:hypothetical protein